MRLVGRRWVDRPRGLRENRREHLRLPAGAGAQQQLLRPGPSAGGGRMSMDPRPAPRSPTWSPSRRRSRRGTGRSATRRFATGRLLCSSSLAAWERGWISATTRGATTSACLPVCSSRGGRGLDKCLFELHCQRVLYLQRKVEKLYGKRMRLAGWRWIDVEIPLYIMVSKMNNKDTLACICCRGRWTRRLRGAPLLRLEPESGSLLLARYSARRLSIPKGYVPCTDENGKLVLYRPYQVSCGSTLPPLVVYFSWG